MRTSAIVRLIIWSIVALGLTAVLVTCLTVDGSRLGDWSFGVVGTRYDNSHLYTAGGTELDADKVSALEVHWTAGEVHIATYDGDTVQVSEQAGETLEEEKQLHWRLTSGGRLIVQHIASGWHWGSFRVPHKELIVEVPRDMAALLELELEVVSAETTVTGLQADGMDVQSVSGGVKLQEVQTNTLELETVSGGVTVDGEFRRVDAESVSGKLELRSSVCPDQVDAETVSGKLVLTIPDNDGFTCELDTVSGSIHSDFADKTSKSRIVYGDGGARFDVETVSGDVSIYRGE